MEIDECVRLMAKSDNLWIEYYLKNGVVCWQGVDKKWRESSTIGDLEKGFSEVMAYRQLSTKD